MATAAAPRCAPRLLHTRFFPSRPTLNLQQHFQPSYHRNFHASPSTMTKTVYFDCAWKGPEVTVDSNGKVTNVDKSGDKGKQQANTSRSHTGTLAPKAVSMSSKETRKAPLLSCRHTAPAMKAQNAVVTTVKSPFVRGWVAEFRTAPPWSG